MNSIKAKGIVNRHCQAAMRLRPSQLSQGERLPRRPVGLLAMTKIIAVLMIMQFGAAAQGEIWFRAVKGISCLPDIANGSVDAVALIDGAFIYDTRPKLYSNSAWIDLLTNILTDNTTNALDIQQGSDNYININTTDAATGELITFGNATTDPNFVFDGSGSVTLWDASANATYHNDVAGVGTSLATTLYFDADLTISGLQDGDGIWDTTTLNWWDSDTSSYVAWDNTAGYTAVFRRN